MKAFFTIVVLLFSACTNVTPFIVTGKSLAALDNQFADTGAAMNAGLDAGKVTPEQYRKWAAFAKKYKPIENLAYEAWTLSTELNDLALAGKFGEALGLLGAELINFYVQMKDAQLLPAGAP